MEISFLRVTTRPQCRPAQKLPSALVTRSSHPELVTQCTEKATRDARKWPCDLVGVTGLNRRPLSGELMDRMGHSSTRAAYIYQHRTALRDKMIADEISRRVEAALR
jgi:hypothetical protein